MTVGTVAPSAWPKARKLRISGSYYATYLLLGLMLTSIGPCMNDLEEQTGSSTSAVGFLVVILSLGYMAGSIVGGRLYGGLFGHRIMSTSMLAMAAATLTIPWLGELWLLIVAFFLIGLALGIVDVGGNTLLVWLYGSEVPPYMNALHLCFGIGAFIGPLVMNGFAAATGSAVNTYWLYAALMLPAVLWLAEMPSPEAPTAAQASPALGGALRRYWPIIALISAFFFMHMGAELAFGAYITSYADDLFYSESLARVVNSVFWGGLVAGRLLAIPLATRLRAGGMLRIDLLGAILGVGLILLLPDATAALWVGTIVLGMSIASMIPSSINYAGERMPITGQITALFLVGGSLGSTILPLIVGRLYGDAPNTRPEMMVYVTAIAVVAAVALFAALALATRRSPAGEDAAITS
ncbi:MAG: MFS transporter [Acidimicrobiia bacterium]|nr:MFS transporter [Acidimicrobiia bacterium]